LNSSSGAALMVIALMEVETDEERSDKGWSSIVVDNY
jgi:hypothetical protein